EAARKDLERTVELSPDDYAAWEMKGDLDAQLGDAAAAEADFGRAIARWQGSGYAWSRRGMLRAGRGDDEGGIVDMKRALQLGISGGDASTRVKLGQALVRTRRLDEAIETLDPVIQKSPRLS